MSYPLEGLHVLEHVAMKVLVIEDSERLRRSLGSGLTKAGNTVDLAADGKEGLSFAETYQYDVIILDLMLPELPGIEVLRRLREAEIDTHVLILSARDRVEDRLRGFEAGADDYLVKPFSFEELRARLQALVRRQHQSKVERIRIGTLEIDFPTRRVFQAGVEVQLTPSEYSLLEFLAYRRGRVVSQDQLFEHLHPSDTETSSNVVEVLISSLRKKIHRSDQPPTIETRRGFGYFIETAETREGDVE